MAAVVAAAELVLLVIVGGALIAKPERAAGRPPSKTAGAAAKPDASASLQQSVARFAGAELPRRKVEVVVLNGNGRQGAAAAIASRVRRKGYRVGLVANAPSHDYATSLVMYRRGFAGEARRLARDLGVRVVSPLDGIRPAQLHGAHAVLILGT